MLTIVDIQDVDALIHRGLQSNILINIAIFIYSIYYFYKAKFPFYYYSLAWATYKSLDKCLILSVFSNF